MNWERIIAAADGRPQSLAWFVYQGTDANGAALATLLLLDDAPHPAAALIAAARMVRRYGVLPTYAALAPQIDAALAAWRADPQWVGRAVGAAAGKRATKNVAWMVRALRDRPAALRDAVDIVLRDGDVAIGRLLAALGADGLRALKKDQRAALLKKAPLAVRVWFWIARNDAPRAAATRRTKGWRFNAAEIIGRIDAAAWQAITSAVRRDLIDAAVRNPTGVHVTACSCLDLTDGERAVLARSVIERGDSWAAFHVLKNLGAAGRATLAADLRAALERRAMESPGAWRVLALRAADDGWTALTDEERSAMMTAAEQEPWRTSVILYAVGVAGWRAMTADEQTRLAAVVRRAPAALFACPPALWSALAGAALPPATEISWDDPKFWRAEDADADLGGLPPAHQMLVLALAPWRAADAASDSARGPRLLAAWSAMPDDERGARSGGASVRFGDRRRRGAAARPPPSPPSAKRSPGS